MNKRELVSAIRTWYPAPVVGCNPAEKYEAFKLRTKNGYCVGGAFCMFVHPDEGDTFPDLEALANELHEYLDLDYGLAEEYAGQIIEANDKGDFENAWSLLDEVINYGPTNPSGVLRAINEES